MDIKTSILKKLTQRKEIKVAEITKATGFSRAYVNRFFQELKDEGKIMLIGRANKARYVMTGKKTKAAVLEFSRILRNKDISEDLVLDDIKRETGIFLHLPKNVSKIVDYAFTEMLNNAITHSKSETIAMRVKKEDSWLRFEIADRGVGIFNNIIKKRRLKNELEAIQDLLKGKQTTAPEEHTGEGIFFTSKLADNLVIQSSTKKLIFDNILKDLFIKNVKNTRGTKINFAISVKSKIDLNSVFKKFTVGVFTFGKTEVSVNLYKMDTDFISRSQARRILSGLDKFGTVLLNFQGVETIGQAFADEVFRVWQKHHQNIMIKYKNANENVEFMIKRAMA